MASYVGAEGIGVAADDGGASSEAIASRQVLITPLKSGYIGLSSNRASLLS